MSAEFEWIEEWPAPGICRLARSRVRSEEACDASRSCSIWLLVHENEAALVEAPFASVDAEPILDRIRARLEESHLWLKFFTVTHLHRGHAAGLGELARAFPRATFVHPEDWLAHRKALREFGDTAASAFDRALAFSYGSVWEFDLAGEPLAFLRAPYHSPTDQLVVFRGVALLPDWQLPKSGSDAIAKPAVPLAELRAAMRRIDDFGRSYRVHSHLRTHGDGPLETDFAERVRLALDSLPTD